MVNMDNVNTPSHYTQLKGVEVKDIIEAVMFFQPDLTAWEGYCLGNVIKYRMRAGCKTNAAEDLDKAGVYTRWFNNSRNAHEGDKER